MRLAIVRNPRTTGGSNQRVATWRRLADALDIEVHEVLPEVGWQAPLRGIGGVRQLARGEAVPEALLVDQRAISRQLRDIGPDVVLLQTLRTYGQPVVDGPWLTVLDFVDRLSVSYRQRAGAANTLSGPALRVLAALHRRVEDRSSSFAIRRVSAGRTGAASLSVPWIPILAPSDVVAIEPPHDPEFDAVFFGSLNYPPNYQALRWLARTDHIGSIKVLVTGSRAHASVEPLCRKMGWCYEPDYPDVASLGSRAAVAVVPLVSAAGIQIKVLEAAAYGIPQVVTAMAMQGFDHEFPVRRADGRRDFAELVAALSKDLDQREDLALSAKRHVENHYQEAAWLEEVGRLFKA